MATNFGVEWALTLIGGPRPTGKEPAAAQAEAYDELAAAYQVLVDQAAEDCDIDTMTYRMRVRDTFRSIAAQWHDQAERA